MVYYRAIMTDKCVYDHRIRDAIWLTKNPNLFPELNIPYSTTYGWIKRPPKPVVTTDAFLKSQPNTMLEIAKLQKRVQVLTALLRLTMTLLRVMDIRLDGERLPQGKAKRRLLHAIQRVRPVLPLKIALRILHLSPSRYHRWRRADECGLDDPSSCPKSSPMQLTSTEVHQIKELVTSESYKHMPLRTLALFAQRIGAVFASVGMWYKLAKKYRWKRPRFRLYPEKSKIGIRASRPNEYLHIDVSIIKLIDGTKAYIHAVIDNFSRRILAWKVAEKLTPQGTYEVLIKAVQQMIQCDKPPKVVVDLGIENLNKTVDQLVKENLIERILAQVDVDFSNSMVESFWRSLKHNGLFLQSLDGFAALRRHVAFYVAEHNSQMPHNAFQGQTPDEVCFEKGADIVDNLKTQRWVARKERIATNQATRCNACPVKRVAA